MTKRGESDEDRANNIEGRIGQTEAQRGRVTVERILCQKAPANQCNCAWYLKP